MHRALQLHEILSLIFRNLLQNHSDGSHLQVHLLACSRTCRAFSEAALDVIWEKPSSISVMPFASPSFYKTVLDPDGAKPAAYSNHLERLVFYGKRVRTLRVHRKLTSELLECILPIGDQSDGAVALPSSFMSTIFPGVTTLTLVLSVNPIFDSLNETRITTFLSPSVSALSLYCAPGARYGDLSIILRSVNALRPNLTSLALGWEIVMDFSSSPPSELNLELSQLLEALSKLEKLLLPLYLLTEPVFMAIANLPELKQLDLAHPNHVQWSRANITPPGNLESSALQEDSFTSLRSLTISSTFKYIPNALYAHPSVTSHITRLSLSCLPPPPFLTLQPFFLPSLSSSALQFLTHLSLNFISAMPVPQRDDLGGRFLEPLFAAPFAQNLVSLHVVHRAPLFMDDKEYEDIARRIPSIEFLRFEVLRHHPPRGVPQPQRPSQLSASLEVLVSFRRHCPRLRELTLSVDAETFPVPQPESLPTHLGKHAVDVDMSVSRVGNDPEGIIAKFFARLFPHWRSELTSHWADGVQSVDSVSWQGARLGLESAGDSEEDERDIWARRWKAVGQRARKERQILAAGELVC